MPGADDRRWPDTPGMAVELRRQHRLITMQERHARRQQRRPGVFGYGRGLTDQQSDAVLAALRLLASEIKAGRVGGADEDIGSILTNGGEHAGLTFDEVMDLGDIFHQGLVST